MQYSIFLRRELGTQCVKGMHSNLTLQLALVKKRHASVVCVRSVGRQIIKYTAVNIGLACLVYIASRIVESVLKMPHIINARRSVELLQD